MWSWTLGETLRFLHEGPPTPTSQNSAGPDLLRTEARTYRMGYKSRYQGTQLGSKGLKSGYKQDISWVLRAHLIFSVLLDAGALSPHFQGPHSPTCNTSRIWQACRGFPFVFLVGFAGFQAWASKARIFAKQIIPARP